MIRIVIADDHVLIREGIKKIVRSSKDIRIVGEACDIAETLHLVAQHIPDLIVLDIGLPGCEGLAGMSEVQGRFPDIPILILSMFPEERFAVQALKLGAAGYISKAMAAEELIKAIHRIFSAGTYVSQRVAELLASNCRKSIGGSLHHCLTERELQIVSLLGAGKQSKQIAAELSIGVSTVNTYRARIFAKMDLRSNAELIRYAVQHGLAD
ncbi:MAG TPA: response regulator transcription factor [Herbaspirillum sp.]|nr:response regulator transcription factor [Herbaspirillum sp.]